MPLRSALAALVIVPAMMIGACGTSKAAQPAQSALDALPAVERVSLLDVPPAAVRVPDAPGLNVEDLAARLRDAVSMTSGVDVIDELSVKKALGSVECEEGPPCGGGIAEKYQAAAFVVASSVSRIGATFLSTVRIQRGVEELARTTGQAPDARVSLVMAGRAAGTQLRKRLLAQGAAERVDAPPGAGDVVDDEATERGDEP